MMKIGFAIALLLSIPASGQIQRIGQPLQTTGPNVHYSGADLCAQIAAAIAALPSGGGYINVDGLSAASPAVCSANPFAANNTSKKPLHISLGPGIIDTTAQWLISSNNVYLSGAGATATILEYTGSSSLVDPGGTNPGAIVEFDTATPTATYVDGDALSNIFISGNTHAPYGVLLDGAHHNSLQNVFVWNVTASGIESKFAVANTLFRVHVTSTDAVVAGVSQIVSPLNGISLDGESAAYASTASTITDPITEYLTGCGIEMSNAFGNTVTSGTSEANGTPGNRATGNICLTAGGGFGGARNNSFISIDTESPNSGENLIDHGESNQFIAINVDQTADVYGASDTFSGGHLHQLNIDSSASDVLIESSVVGSITDNGTKTSLLSISAENPNRYTGFPWQERSTTFSLPYTIRGLADNSSDLLTGAYSFNTSSATILSNSALTADSHWHAIFMGQWLNDLNGTGMLQLAPLIEISDANPTIAAGSCILTFSIGSRGRFQGLVTTGTSCHATFNGRVIVVPGNNNAGGTTAIKTLDTIDAGAIGSGGAMWTSGATVPSSNCAVGSLYSNTAASSRSTALYICYPANTWTAVTVP